MENSVESYTPHTRMRQLIIDNNLLLMSLSRFNIAFGFGEANIEEVCRLNDVDVDTFLAVCNMLSGYDYEKYKVDTETLMSYLKVAHKTFLDFTLPKIRHNIIDAINYSDSDDVAFLLIRFFDDYVKEVKRHMEYENDFIFKYVEELNRGNINENFNISRFSENHGDMATKLKDLKDVFIHHFKQKDNIKLSAVLFDIITCEKDLMSHFDIESKLLVPAVVSLENSMRTQLKELPDETCNPQEEEDAALASLGDREKDIIRCVAKGMANKEIADSLFLSIHTVTTHRRNIASKLGIHSTAGLTVFAILHHLVDIDEC